MILAGDIGGTATRLALFETNGERVTIVAGATFSSSSLSGLGDAIEQFINTRRRTIKAAGFGIAGPVIDGRAKLPNLPWSVDVRNWRGSSDCREWSFSTISKPTHTVLPRLAGTTWCRSTSRPARCGETQRSSRPEPDWARQACIGTDLSIGPLRRTEAFRQHEGPAAISAAALSGTDETAVAALRLFVSCLGAEAGNLALRMMALGGVYVGGGIAPRILHMLSDGVFISAFVDKGRMRSLLETIPVWVIRNDKTALLGAARYAAKQAQAEPPLAEWATASFARSFAERGAGALQGT
jgi:glucokinase